jgi:hypothetical protein
MKLTVVFRNSGDAPNIKDRIDVACSTEGRGEKCTQSFCWHTLEQLTGCLGRQLVSVHTMAPRKERLYCNSSARGKGMACVY